jgi:ribonuclease P protein component
VIRPIRTTREFQELRSTGRRVSSGPLTMIVSPLPDPEVTRVAYAIGRPVGTAVHRNRLRRRLRAVVADHDRGGRLPSSAYLVICRAEARHLDHPELISCVDELLVRAAGTP